MAWKAVVNPILVGKAQMMMISFLLLRMVEWVKFMLLFIADSSPKQIIFLITIIIMYIIG